MHCQQIFKVKKEDFGNKVKCSECNQLQRAPMFFKAEQLVQEDTEIVEHVPNKTIVSNEILESLKDLNEEIERENNEGEEQDLNQQKYDNLVHATNKLGNRVVAIWIDYAFLAFVFYASLALPNPGILLSFFVTIIYFPLMEGVCGVTIGKCFLV